MLRRYYSAEEAQAQLDTAIDWGRRSELYEYAAQTSELTEPPGVPGAKGSG